jgi:hypothetical protein
MIKYLKSTEMLPLILTADDSDNLYWYADSVFGVHADMNKSHNRKGVCVDLASRGRGLFANTLTYRGLARSPPLMHFEY